LPVWLEAGEQQVTHDRYTNKCFMLHSPNRSPQENYLADWNKRRLKIRQGQKNNSTGKAPQRTARFIL